MSDSGSIDPELLKRFTPLNSLSETHLNDIRRKSRLVQLPKGKILFKRDEPNEDLHFLVRGEVDLADASFNIRKLRAGSPEALSALDTGDRHAFTAVTTGDVQVLTMDKDYLDLVLTWNEAGNYVVTDLAEDEDLLEDDWMSALLQSHIFVAVPPANIQKMFALFEEVNVKAGQSIFRQGEPGDYFYAIKSGTCQVLRRMSSDGNLKDVVLAELHVGDVFGEDALIGDAPRNATIVMAKDGALMRIGKEDFQSLMSDPVIREISYEDLTRRLQDPAQQTDLVDVRLPLEYKQGHLPGARSLPLHSLRTTINDLDEGVTYVTTCDGGRRASLAAYILSQNGFDALVLVDPPDQVESAA